MATSVRFAALTVTRGSADLCALEPAPSVRDWDYITAGLEGVEPISGVDALFAVATAAGTDLRFIAIAREVESLTASLIGKDLRLNVSGAIPSVLLGAGFPLEALKGVPILARTAGLIAHLYEELQQPIGFALTYQATRELQYTGEAAK
jgi:hypothetical protein